ncbi:MAG: hypothetical protein JJ992_05005 [Planctomycetes bacterium]|nr:hypothetical protein [Planctomycetota bacterium]
MKRHAADIDLTVIVQVRAVACCQNVPFADKGAAADKPINTVGREDLDAANTGEGRRRGVGIHSIGRRIRWDARWISSHNGAADQRRVNGFNKRRRQAFATQERTRLKHFKSAERGSIASALLER